MKGNQALQKANKPFERQISFTKGKQAGQHWANKLCGTHMMPLQLEALLGGHVVLLEQVAFLGEQGVAVGDGGCDGHFVIGVLLVHDAVVEQQAAVGLWATPGKDWITCTVIPLCCTHKRRRKRKTGGKKEKKAQEKKLEKEKERKKVCHYCCRRQC